MEADELGMEADEGSVDSVPNVRRNIPLMLKGSRAGRKKPSSPRRRTKEPQPPPEPVEADLPVLRGPAEPTHKKQTLRWDHRVNLIGEKVTDPRIHCCERCDLPILIYGRMIPCKHVFCHQCATKCGKKCGRCSDNVTRIEQCAVGTVYVCTYEGPRHSWEGCRRTYLSHRDLQAHIEHRHLKTSKKRSAPSSAAGVVNPQTAAALQAAVGTLSQVPQIHTSVAIPDLSIPPPDFSGGTSFPGGPPPASLPSQYPSNAPAVSFSHPPPTATASTTVVANNVNFPMGVPRSNNLISIPILDSGSQQQLGGSGYPQQLPPQQPQQQFFNPQQTPGGPDLSRPPPNFAGPPPAGNQGVNMSQPPPFHPPGPFNSPPDGSPRHNWSGPPPGRGAPGNMRPPRGPSGGHRNYYQ